MIATIVATITSYLMNRHWTYRDRPKSALRREYVLFFLFNGAGLVIELGVLAAAKYGLGVTQPARAERREDRSASCWPRCSASGPTGRSSSSRCPSTPQETWHAIPRDEWDTDGRDGPGGRAGRVGQRAGGVGAAAGAGRRAPHATGPSRAAAEPGAPVQGRPAPLDAGLGGALDRDLDAELAAELQRRRARR